MAMSPQAVEFVEEALVVLNVPELSMDATVLLQRPAGR